MKIRRGLRGVDSEITLYPFLADHDWALATQFEHITIGDTQYPFRDAEATDPVTDNGDPTGHVVGLQGAPSVIQEVSADRPVWGADGVEFSGAEDFLAGGYASLGEDFIGSDSEGTMIFLLSPGVIGGDTVRFFGARDSGTTRLFDFIYDFPDAGGVAVQLRSASGGIRQLEAESVFASTGDRVAVAFRNNLGALTLFGGGDVLATDSQKNAAAPIDRIPRLGARTDANGSAAAHYTGDIISAWIVDEALSDAQIASISEALL